jgi:hypothetical protein
LLLYCVPRTYRKATSVKGALVVGCREAAQSLVKYRGMAYLVFPYGREISSIEDRKNARNPVETGGGQVSNGRGGCKEASQST